MSERASYMPSDVEINGAWFAATEICPNAKVPGLAGAMIKDHEPLRALIASAVEKALAEQKQEWVAALKTASGGYKCHPDFAEMWAKAESDPTYWAELLRSSRDAYRNQEARHRREEINAVLGAVADASERGVDPAWCERYSDELRAELDALERGNL